MKIEPSILFDEHNSSAKVCFSQSLPDAVELCLQIESEVKCEDIDEFEFLVDITYVVPGKGQISKISSILHDDIFHGRGITKSYLGEFIRAVKIICKTPLQKATVTLYADECKTETREELNEDTQMFNLLSDNWMLFAENVRKLNSRQLNTFIVNKLNHIQEINGCSTFLIDYFLQKQIYKFWGTGVIDIDQVDSAQVAYLGGYNFINENNLITMQKYGEGKLA